jgi:AraC-like DNA-binding protein
MKYLELPPCTQLRPYIQLIWCFELDADEDSGPPERIAPDGIAEMVFHYRDPMAMRYAGEAFALQPRSSIVSQTRRFVEIYPRGSTGLISVRFRPWGAYHFFRPPVAEIADHLVSAQDLWGSAVRELEERLVAATDTRQRADLVEEFLLAQLRRHQKADVEALVRTVWSRKGQLRVPELCREVGLTERSVQRIFAAALGTPPKSFARLARFLHACSVLREGSWSSLVQVAHDCGYYDQPHFIGDFKALSGMTPGTFSTSHNFSFLELE